MTTPVSIGSWMKRASRPKRLSRRVAGLNSSRPSPSLKSARVLRMSNIKLFESRQIRSIWLDIERQWFFSVIDAVVPLTNRAKPCDYRYHNMQHENISRIELSTICRQLKLLTSVGKDRETDCVTTEVRKRITWNKIKPGDAP